MSMIVALWCSQGLASEDSVLLNCARHSGGKCIIHCVALCRYSTLPVHDHLWFIALHKLRAQLPDCTYTNLSSPLLSWYTLFIHPSNSRCCFSHRICRLESHTSCFRQSLTILLNASLITDNHTFCHFHSWLIFVQAPFDHFTHVSTTLSISSATPLIFCSITVYWSCWFPGWPWCGQRNSLYYTRCRLSWGCSILHWQLSTGMNGCECISMDISK